MEQFKFPVAEKEPVDGDMEAGSEKKEGREEWVGRLEAMREEIVSLAAKKTGGKGRGWFMQEAHDFNKDINQKFESKKREMLSAGKNEEAGKWDVNKYVAKQILGMGTVEGKDEMPWLDFPKPYRVEDFFQALKKELEAMEDIGDKK